MTSDTLTFALHGSVSLEQFAAGVRHFSQLVSDLTAEVGGGGVRWEIEDLRAGSAIATFRGSAVDGDGDHAVAAVVSAYLAVGQALEDRRQIPYSHGVQRDALEILKLADTGLDYIRFETAEAEAMVTHAIAEWGDLPDRRHRAPALGAVVGRVQTVTSRSRLRFTLYDRLHDRAVSCYLAEGAEDRMRDIWDRTALVEGLVSRDPISGRPMSVRQVKDVQIIEEGAKGDYRRARGALPRDPTDTKRAEEWIRRLRDAG